MDDLMDTTSYGKAARLKFGSVPEGFHIYQAEWLGETPTDWTRMRVTGAAFNGERRIPGTTMTTIVTREEMAAQAARSTTIEASRRRSALERQVGSASEARPKQRGQRRRR